MPRSMERWLSLVSTGGWPTHLKRLGRDITSNVKQGSGVLDGDQHTNTEGMNGGRNNLHVVKLCGKR